MLADPVLQIEQLTVERQEKAILKHLSCQAYPGELVILKGVNGSGKSTLLDAIVGRIQPQEGRISLKGENMVGRTEKERSRWISRMSQNTLAGCFPSLTVQENLAIASLKGQKATLKNSHARFLRQALTDQLASVDIDLDPLLHRPMGCLSGGQRQILTFVMATLMHPALLLLDEPTAALDPDSASKLVHLMLDFIKRTQAATIMITHDMTLANQLKGRQWYMFQGQIVEESG
ncbi:ATP-binding cassette domain-containing protein [Candidatus Protochlamydia phocaeensis]|uniref:ATP-binding cassette domain-containing protein n=1 Tax=Candidatus Protochlamydia phocaeensis TaxID=1414722 RepID=UPI0008380394|nr:ATP-binding cassette domain-containing protein [Candidatus Protochlamydia phocaeensis]